MHVSTWGLPLSSIDQLKRRIYYEGESGGYSSGYYFIYESCTEHHLQVSPLVEGETSLSFEEEKGKSTRFFTI